MTLQEKREVVRAVSAGSALAPTRDVGIASFFRGVGGSLGYGTVDVVQAGVARRTAKASKDASGGRPYGGHVRDALGPPGNLP